MISRMLLVWPRCVCWEYAEAQHRSTKTSPMVVFCTAVSSGYYDSTGRLPAGGVSAAARATRMRPESEPLVAYRRARLLLRRDVGDDVVLVTVGNAGKYTHGGAGDHDGGQCDPGTEQPLGPLKGRGVAERVGVFEIRHSAGALADNA